MRFLCLTILLIVCSAYSTILWLLALTAIFYVGYQFVQRYVMNVRTLSFFVVFLEQVFFVGNWSLDRESVISNEGLRF